MKLINLIFLFVIIFQSIEPKKFLFSVIISIYNTGRYLHDSIGSVLNQTINFDNIQIILVNDGSIDNSEEICFYYKEQYPKNIIYIKINHSGVSKARNIGIKYAKGQLINFLDSDDKWDKNAFKLVMLFFRFFSSINIVACRLIFFEAKENYHPLDYKFYKTRIVNLKEEYNCIHLSSSSSFFRYSLIKNETFKEGVFNGEDTRFINNLLLLNPFLGIIKEAIYYYRKRLDSTSAVQNSIKNKEYYFSIFNLVDQYLIDKSKRLYKKLLPFIQFYLAYNILFRLSFPSYQYLEKDQLYKYYGYIEKILKQIEDKYILEQKILSFKEKFLALSKKYNREVRNDIEIYKESLIYSGNTFMNIKKYKGILVWRILEVKHNILHLEGKENFIHKKENYFFFCKSDNNVFYPEYFDYSGYDLKTIYGIIDKGRIVVFNIPLKNNTNQIFKFYLSYHNYEIEIFPSLGWFAHIPSLLNGYYNSGIKILKYIDGRLNVFQYSKHLKDLFENQYIDELKKIRKINIIKTRKNYFDYLKGNKVNNIWIINDKQNIARDNGEYFFRYLKEKNPKDIKYYFVIRKDCLDYIRLKHLGNIMELESEEYLNTFLKANKIITSVSESWVDNPFGNDRKYIRDLFHFEFIFIQHGIIKDDLSKYLNRITKNFNYIITSSVKEYKSILNYKYNYNINNLKLTGLPRFDRLLKLKPKINKEKIILISPTWRMYIKGAFDSNTFESIYYHEFKLTDYFNFFNKLINDEKLLNDMKKFNYSGIFCIHPYFSKQWQDFKENNFFSVLELCDFQNIVLKSSLLITDYSSIFFDFAYIQRPIIYTHFDYKEYRKYHYPQGYFDYERNGFGPICYTLNCTVKEIISKMEKNCSIDNKFKKRIKGFFTFIDENNCERLFYSILNNPGYIFITKNNNSNYPYIYLLIILNFIFTQLS